MKAVRVGLMYVLALAAIILTVYLAVKAIERPLEKPPQERRLR